MRDMSFKTRAPDESGMKDLWRTPKHIFDAANARFSFNVDLAARDRKSTRLNSSH